MPRSEEGYVRVPHPFAGRHPVLLPVLPLDLHVLGLPLAFILSQDQTLHCINCFSLLFYIRRVNVCYRAWFNSNTLSNSYSLIFGYSFLSKNGYINMT